MDSASGHSASHYGEVKTAGDLPREGWHESPVVRGGWPGWTASGHSTSRHGEGINSLKLSEDLWGPARWQSRLDSFPYSEPLTNLAS
ncbi:hypothetical protein CRG98_033583 [Punica granatum]|uniref:Uncharacterized protein n=1 Tax=Punica granatum TaxID=22663 RepID=A0A2I0IPU9_PUNGR|nr:hypothetical protein CRG98_033583 [Punica granatum]